MTTLTDFNPRSPCGERHRPERHADYIITDFNPRSPCGERRSRCCQTSISFPFQSTLPLRGATTNQAYRSQARMIFQSTLPLRGATSCTFRCTRRISYFNPRSPCGERPGACQAGTQQFLFQSTLPLRGATSMAAPTCRAVRFQSTLPLRGATANLYKNRLITYDTITNGAGNCSKNFPFQQYNWVRNDAN